MALPHSLKPMPPYIIVFFLSLFCAADSADYSLKGNLPRALAGRKWAERIIFLCDGLPMGVIGLNGKSKEPRLGHKVVC